MPVRSAKAGDDAVAGVVEADQFGATLDGDAQRLQPLDQQPLMLVLREDMQEGIGGQTLADRLERQARGLLAPDPEIDRRVLVAAGDDLAGQVELAVELQGAGLDRQGSRGGSGFGGLVDDAHLDPKLGQPERQHQPGRPGADDQDIASCHRASPRSRPCSTVSACCFAMALRSGASVTASPNTSR